MLHENLWLFNGRPVSDDDFSENVAFVYRITNLETQKKYIGKKLLQKTRTKLVKGKKKKVKSDAEPSVEVTDLSSIGAAIIANKLGV